MSIFVFITDRIVWKEMEELLHHSTRSFLMSLVRKPHTKLKAVVEVSKTKSLDKMAGLKEVRMNLERGQVKTENFKN